MKSPPVQYHDDQAREMTEEFIYQQTRRETELKETSEPNVVAPENLTNGRKVETQAN
jgi:hypothetical protein